MNLFQLTAARRRLGLILLHACYFYSVSTHSRPKAAGTMRPTLCATCACFNSQPPEGGWIRIDKFMAFQILFQLTAARRRLGDDFNGQIGINRFQLTAARRRLGLKLHSSCPYSLFQLTAARRRLGGFDLVRLKSYIRFNSQPPEGGWGCAGERIAARGGFNSQPPEGGWAQTAHD